MFLNFVLMIVYLEKLGFFVGFGVCKVWLFV